MRAATTRFALIREITLRGQRELIERHHLLRALTYLNEQCRCDIVRDSRELRMPSLRISLHDWSHPAVDVLCFDRLLECVSKDGDIRLDLWCGDWIVGSQAAIELLNRYQRLLPLPRKSPASQQVQHALRIYATVFPAHAEASSARNAAGLDTWRWILRLAGRPSFELQLAALFHDLSLGKLEEALAPLELGRGALLRVAELTLFYDEPAGDRELAALQSARAVSFFSLESWRFLRQRGSSAACERAEQLLAVMDGAALCAALTTRQPSVIGDVMEHVFRRAASATPEPRSAPVHQLSW